jgi:hypothetical protein
VSNNLLFERLCVIFISWDKLKLVCGHVSNFYATYICCTVQSVHAIYDYTFILKLCKELITFLIFSNNLCVRHVRTSSKGRKLKVVFAKMSLKLNWLSQGLVSKLTSFATQNTQCKAPSEANVIKLLTVVVYEFSLSVRVFVHGEPFQPSLMSVNEASSLL